MSRCRVRPVKRDPGPHQIMMRVGPEENSRRIGERRGDAAVHHPQIAKELDLAIIERMRWIIGARKVTHDQHDAVIETSHAR